MKTNEKFLPIKFLLIKKLKQGKGEENIAAVLNRNFRESRIANFGILESQILGFSY